MTQTPPASTPPASPVRRRLGAGAILSLGAAAVLLVLVLQNRSDVKFRFLGWSFTWPLWLYTIVVAALGALIWIGAGVLRRHRRRKARRAARAEKV
mgnify:CR=1 FL=1